MRDSFRLQWSETFSAVRWFVLSGLVLVAFAITIVVAPWLDDHGYPGSVFALVVWGAAIVLSLSSALSIWPRRRRRVAMSRFARDRDGTFVERFAMPASLRDLPSYSIPFKGSGVRNLVTIRDGSGPIVLFDRWVEGPSAYADTVWTVVAAREMPLRGGRVIVCPHGWLPFVADGLAEVRTESDEFDRRFRVRCSDRRFASALLDQRMITWLLGLHEDHIFEAGGRWLSVGVAGSIRTNTLDDLVDTLERFAEHVPRVTASLFPPSPAPRGSHP